MRLFLVKNAVNDYLWDVALNLETAKHLGLHNIPQSPLEINWAKSAGGDLCAYSLDGERVYIKITECEADVWPVDMRHEVTE